MRSPFSAPVNPSLCSEEPFVVDMNTYDSDADAAAYGGDEL